MVSVGFGLRRDGGRWTFEIDRKISDDSTAVLLGQLNKKIGSYEGSYFLSYGRMMTQ